MLDAGYLRLRARDRRHGEHAFKPGSPLSLMHKESSDLFGAFLNEFTGDTWSLQDVEDLSSSSMSTFTNGNDACHRNDSNMGAPGAILRAASSDGPEILRTASINGREISTTENLRCREQVKDDGLEAKDGDEKEAEGKGTEKLSRRTRYLDLQSVVIEDDYARSRLPTNNSSSDDPCPAGFGAAPESSPALERSASPPSQKAATKTATACRCVPAAPASSAPAAAPDASWTNKTISYTAVRALTNTTYLRRMHLSKEDAVGLFPEVLRSLHSVFAKKMQQRGSTRLFKMGTSVCIEDATGRRWPVTIECVRTAGQRHVRFNKGWAEMCVANGFAVGMCIRLDRWEQETASSSSSSLSTPSQEIAIVVNISLV